MRPAAHRHLDILGHRLGTEQRALLEQDAPPQLEPLQVFAVDLRRFLAEHLDTARLRVVQADDGAQQDRFAGARAAHHAQHFAAQDVEIDVVVHDGVAECVDEPADADHDLAGADVFFHHMPSTEKSTENPASSTMIEEDRFDDGARRQLADARGVALDAQAFEASDQRDDEREHRRLDKADKQVSSA